MPISTASLCLHHDTGLHVHDLVAQTPCAKSGFISNLPFFLIKEQHMSCKTFFDKPITRIIRHIANNEEQSDSKYILSTASPTTRSLQMSLVEHLSVCREA